jgi:hypothetical protein
MCATSIMMVVNAVSPAGSTLQTFRVSSPANLAQTVEVYSPQVGRVGGVDASAGESLVEC